MPPLYLPTDPRYAAFLLARYYEPRELIAPLTRIAEALETPKAQRQAERKEEWARQWLLREAYKAALDAGADEL